MKIAILGLSITSSWGNGHATTYRGLVKELARRGHQVIFFERDVPWYASNRDLPSPSYCALRLYQSFEELADCHGGDIRTSELVMVGSYVPEGVKVGKWVTEISTGVKAFYDIDTPVTLDKLRRGDYEYISPELIPKYDIYLSFTGGPTLKILENHYGAQKARALYCSVDPEVYFPSGIQPYWDLGYIGTYSADRQCALSRYLLEPSQRLAGRFVVAGSLYPEDISWPRNVKRIEHLPPGRHREFYCSQRFTLNITRINMIKAGFSPSVRLFEAAGCGTPIISDYWDGINSVFRPGEEILIARTENDVISYLLNLSAAECERLSRNARTRVLAEHTAAHRAESLEQYVLGKK